MCRLIRFTLACRECDRIGLVLTSIPTERTYRRYAPRMSEHENHEAPKEYTYVVGAGLGLLGGVIVGLFMGEVIPAVLIGMVVGIVIAWGVRLLKP